MLSACARRLDARRRGALVAGPLAVFGAALWLANRRANAKLAAMSEDDGESAAEEPEPEPTESG